MAPFLRTGIVVVCAAALAACQTPFGRGEKRVEPLAAVPQGEIQQSTLPPPPDQPSDQFAAAAPADASDPAEAEQINAIGNTAVAGPAPGANSSSILLGRTALLGGWTVASDGGAPCSPGVTDGGCLRCESCTRHVEPGRCGVSS